MGKCARTTKKVLKGALKVLSPELLRVAQEMVAYAEEAGADNHWSGEEKRKMATMGLRGAAAVLKIFVPTHLINLAIEFAVSAMKNDEVDEIDIGTLDDDDLREIEEPA